MIVFDETIKEYLTEIDEAPLLNWQQECDLAQRVIDNDDPQARDQLVRSNLRLVVSIAKKFATGRMSLGDLIEEGNLGLIRAIDSFDPSVGVRFSTYAAWWIKQSIKRALLMNVQPVHIPTYMVTIINQWRHAAAELQSKLGRQPAVEEMAEIMQLSLKKAHVIQQIVHVISSSRDNSTGEDSEDDQTEQIALQQQDADKPEDAIVAAEEKEKVLKLLKRMDPRQEQILIQHYGLCGQKPVALRQIAEQMGLTRERIRQIQREALARLYEYMNE